MIDEVVLLDKHMKTMKQNTFENNFEIIGVLGKNYENWVKIVELCAKSVGVKIPILKVFLYLIEKKSINQKK